MGTVGIFTGRGDVILMMGIALILGVLLGSYLERMRQKTKVWWTSRKYNKE